LNSRLIRSRLEPLTRVLFNKGVPCQRISFLTRDSSSTREFISTFVTLYLIFYCSRLLRREGVNIACLFSRHWTDMPLVCQASRWIIILVLRLCGFSYPYVSPFIFSVEECLMRAKLAYSARLIGMSTLTRHLPMLTSLLCMGTTRLLRIVFASVTVMDYCTLTPLRRIGYSFCLLLFARFWFSSAAIIT